MATTLLVPTVTLTQNVATVLSTNRHVNGAIIQAHPSNTDVVWIGDSTVSAGSTRGIRLEVPTSGQTMPFLAIGESHGLDAINLGDYYGTSASAGQKVNILYITV